jgi:Asp-tRNA(Asn)/Glu-tRNA(Gln) amidotransferase A subunit family amidase
MAARLPDPPLHALTALQARARLRAGTLSTTDYAQALLARVAATEPAVQAWQAIDADHSSAAGRRRRSRTATRCA